MCVGGGGEGGMGEGEFETWAQTWGQVLIIILESSKSTFITLKYK